MTGARSQVALLRCALFRQQQGTAAPLMALMQAGVGWQAKVVDPGIRTSSTQGGTRDSQRSGVQGTVSALLQPAPSKPATAQHVLRTWSQQQQGWTKTHLQRLAFSTAPLPPSSNGQPETADSSKPQARTASSTSSLASDPLWTLPNMLSLGRAASGPYIAYLIVSQEYTWALGAVLISGLTDWADGAAARALGQNSVLGSYLDPLADKILVGCVAGALSWQGLIPTWLSVLIIGRDAGLVMAAAGARWHMLGWRVRGMTASEFFNTVPGSPGVSGVVASGDGQQLSAGGAPPMRPLMISKVNTVFQLALIAGCLSSHAASWPPQDMLHVLEMTTAATTAASFAAYALRAASGKWHGSGN